jgi:fatty-acyl-CoA synthase
MNPGIKQLLEVAHPRTLGRLQAAGMLGLLSPIGIGAALPWLVGRGPSLGVASLINSIVVGNKTAIVDRHGKITWRELDRNANRFANALTALGLRGPDRIAIVLRNGREFAECVLGAQKLGVVACPVNTWAKEREIAATIERAAPRAVVYDVAHADQLPTSVGAGAALVSVGNGDAFGGSTPYERFLRSGRGIPPAPFANHPGSARIVIQTSGTTGSPKGALRDAAAAGLGELTNLLAVVPYHRDDIIFCPAPMFHSFGLVTFTIATVTGATMILPPRFDAEESLAAIADHGATAASFVPVMIRRICDLDAARRGRYDLSTLRIVLASGSAMSPRLRRDALDAFGEVLYDLYGSTEAGWVTVATPDDIAGHPHTVGHPVPGTEVAIFTSEGERTRAGVSGAIHVRSRVVFEGYTSGESRSSREGFTPIGDVGHLDDDGYLYVEGRADDMVVVGGENVYPIEVEETIEAMPGVDEAAVKGVEDDELGHVLVAFVSGSVAEGDVVAHCRKELASYKVPRRVTVLSELPHTATGKVLKRELLERLG